MDVNNTPFFLFRTAAEFENGSTRLEWRPGPRALMLTDDQPVRWPAPDPETALTAWRGTTPLALDGFGQVARVSDDGGTVEYNSGRGYAPLRDELLGPVEAPEGTIRDLAVGGHHLLAAPWSNGTDRHGLILLHLAKRWMTEVSLETAPIRAWIDHNDRVWCIGEQMLMCCEGSPLPLPYTPEPDRFEPVTVNPDALSESMSTPLPDGLFALAVTGDQERIAILCHDGAGHQQIITRTIRHTDTAPFTVFDIEEGGPFVVDAAMLQDGHIAALSPQHPLESEEAQRDCPVLALSWDSVAARGTARWVRKRYPTIALARPRFVSSADGRPRYPSAADPLDPAPAFPTVDPRPRELHPLRRPQYTQRAKALLQRVLDAGEPDAVWHRLYLDAVIPRGCAVRVSARGFNAPGERTTSPLLPQPAPIWNPLPSELPYAKNPAGVAEGSAGLFEILLQRPGGAVRRLSGRYLQLELELVGNRRQSPAIHSLRVYCPRFSYQEAYLPELFHQEAPVDPADTDGPANGADVRERLFAAMEGVLTPIEGRVAAAEILVDPEAAPVGALTRIAEMVGAAAPTVWPPKRRRRRIVENGRLQQWRGTLAGLNLALDIATDGGVARGEVVVLENFRLRRTMATILGVDMDDEDHPLTLGTGMSGNSLVGESLILSESDTRTFLSLFSPELADRGEAEAVAEFFDKYAHQVTVLLHGAGRRRRSSVVEVLAEEMPAHLQYRIIETEHPFVLGIGPLLSVDTFLETTPGFRRVTLDDTRLGREGVLQNPAAFSPRDINARRGDS